MAKRENGSGSIVRRKRAHGTYYFAYTPAQYSIGPDGKAIAHRELVGKYDTRAEARAALDGWLKHPTCKLNLTLADVYKEWSPTAFKLIAPQTVENYETSWEKIKNHPAHLNEVQMKEITTGDLRQLINDYAYGEHGVKPISKSYIIKLKALLTQLYDYSIENNIVDRNYAKLVKIPKMEEHEKRAFSNVEFAILENGYQSVQGGDAVYALCYLGFRVSEFCQLTIFDYDPVNQTLTGGNKTAAGKRRIVPIHPKIQSIVAGWAKAGGSALYSNSKGKPYNKDSFRKQVWDPVIKALGLPDDLTPHSARHTFGTHMSKAGVRPEDIKKVIGHSSYTVTADTYINQDVETLAEAVQKMA